MTAPAEFRTVDGRQVWVRGEVIIGQIRHRVEAGYVACDSSLNRMAWNVTPEAGRCPACFPAPPPPWGQMDLFGGLL